MIQQVLPHTLSACVTVLHISSVSSLLLQFMLTFDQNLFIFDKLFTNNSDVRQSTS